MKQHCEFCGIGSIATNYGGFSGAGAWAGYVCDEHAKQSGFNVWDHLTLSEVVAVPDRLPRFVHSVDANLIETKVPR